MTNKCQLNDLMKIQKACVRIICKKPSTYNSKVLFEQEHIPTLQNLIDLEAAKFGYKISHNLVPKPIQNIMNAKNWKKHIPIIHAIKQLQISRGTNQHNSIIVSYADQYQPTPAFLRT